MYRFFKLRHLLFISFTLISILPVLVLAVWVQQSAYDKEIAAVKEKHLLLAHNLTGALSRYVTDVESTFRYAARDDISTSSIPELVNVLSSIELLHVCTIDALGDIEKIITFIPQLKSKKRLSPEVIKRLQPDFGKADANPGKVIFSDVIHNDAGQPNIFLIMVKPGNRYAVGALKTDYIVKIARDISFGVKGHAAIVDSAGHVLAHPNAEWRLQMKDISRVTAVSKMMANETGVTIFYSPALKADMIAGFTTVPETGWGVMVPQPIAELKARTYQVGLVMYFFVVVGIIISSLVSWWLARFISRPIQEVVKVAEQVSSGNYTARVQGSAYPVPQELNVLTDSFNTMIAEMSDYENRLRQQATHDQLTNLPNRWLFLDRLERAIIEALRQNKLVALLFIDLDRFKAVNDTYGHDIGDLLLQQVAIRLKNCARKADTVARLGGDEFIIILSHLKQTQMATVVASKIIEAMNEPFFIEGKEIFIGASIGITISPADSEDPVTMLQNGDIAMYQAKASGRNTYRYFTEEMNQQVLKRVEIERCLHGAIERGEISLNYQPIIDVTTKQIASVEVLMRWDHPEMGIVAPATFIPIAEESGMIKLLGEWMLMTACMQAKSWLDEGILEFGLSVNLSSREITLGFSRENIEKVLNETELPAHYLTFEITENIILDDTDEILVLLNDMKKIGVSLSIDDFGTGYSSFSYLPRFPIDIMKIDRAFTKDIASQRASARLIEGMIALGKRLNLKVVAEGIETYEQLALLEQYGCDYAQGFYFLKAVPALELVDYLASIHPGNESACL